MISLWQLSVYCIFQVFCLCILCPDKITIIILHWLQRHLSFSFFPSQLNMQTLHVFPLPSIPFKIPLLSFVFTAFHGTLIFQLGCTLSGSISTGTLRFSSGCALPKRLFDLSVPVAFLCAHRWRFIATGAIHLTWALNVGERRQLKAKDVLVSACRCNGARRVDLKTH